MVTKNWCDYNDRWVQHETTWYCYENQEHWKIARKPCHEPNFKFTIANDLTPVDSGKESYSRRVSFLDPLFSTPRVLRYATYARRVASLEKLNYWETCRVSRRVSTETRGEKRESGSRAAASYVTG